MNESTEELLDKLERATSLDSTEPVDDETAALRESWRALATLLHAADEDSGQPLVVQRHRPQRIGVAVRFLAAVAAALLVAVAAWSALNSRQQSSDTERELAAPSVPVDSPAEVADSAAATRVNEGVDVVDRFAWEDSFDEQLAATSQAIRSAQAGWSGGDRRYSVLLDQLEKFDEELNAGSL